MEKALVEACTDKSLHIGGFSKIETEHGVKLRQSGAVRPHDLVN